MLFWIYIVVCTFRVINHFRVRVRVIRAEHSRQGTFSQTSCSFTVPVENVRFPRFGDLQTHPWNITYFTPTTGKLLTEIVTPIPFMKIKDLVM